MVILVEAATRNLYHRVCVSKNTLDVQDEKNFLIVAV